MKKYNEKAPSKYIMYLDANNLFGWAMSQYLPTGGFKWLTEKQINNPNLAKYEEDSNKGLILEVDRERLLQTYEQQCIRKNHGKYQKASRCQIGN